ncbi:hypothetical protein [Kovacikia minuta]|nr:hypothetical protein [Kovacikia minuta]
MYRSHDALSEIALSMVLDEAIVLRKGRSCYARGDRSVILSD